MPNPTQPPALPFLQMESLALENQRVIIREDFNVPIEDGRVTHRERILRALPTIKMALSAGARVILLSHLGRPTEGKFESEFSLAPIAEVLSEELGEVVPLVANWPEKAITVKPGQAVLCENVRFLVGESKNDPALARQMAKQCDIFVMDAFATAHRAQASTAGIAEYAPVACAGPLLVSEIKALSRALHQPKSPVLAIIGGSKVSTKIQLLENLLSKVDQLILGGGLANTFLKAKGYEIGRSLCENDWLSHAEQFWKKAEAERVLIPLPQDVVVAPSLDQASAATVKAVKDISKDDCIFDIGPETSAHYAELIIQASTVVWNGPLGVFEQKAFSRGTDVIAHAIGKSTAFSIAGGGDTLAALEQFDLQEAISYVSTGGGAFLEFMEGKTLPAIAILEKRART